MFDGVVMPYFICSTGWHGCYGVGDANAACGIAEEVQGKTKRTCEVNSEKRQRVSVNRHLTQAHVTSSQLFVNLCQVLEDQSKTRLPSGATFENYYLSFQIINNVPEHM